MPVPQPDILKRSLIVSRVGSLDGGLRWKLALRDSVQSVGLPCQLGVVDDVGLLANQFVRFHDKTADVPSDSLNGKITDRAWKDCRDQPAPAGDAHSVRRGEHRAEHARYADDEHPGERYVSVLVHHTTEDRTIVEQSIQPRTKRTPAHEQQ